MTESKNYARLLITFLRPIIEEEGEIIEDAILETLVNLGVDAKLHNEVTLNNCTTDSYIEWLMFGKEFTCD